MSSVSASSIVLILSTICITHVISQGFNPTILQDSRDLPKTDGTFGFLYRTEDGIAHAAKGDPDGVIHGRFTYTDPTGLKVNFNYNAGSRVAPGYNYNAQAPAPVPKYRNPPPPKKYYQPAPEPQYNEPDYDNEPAYAEPQYRPAPQPQYRPVSQRRAPVFRDPADVYQERRTRPAHLRQNEVYDDYNYRN